MASALGGAEAIAGRYLWASKISVGQLKTTREVPPEARGDSVTEAIKPLSPRSRGNRRWTKEEDEQLEALRRDNIHRFEIAAKLCRTVAAVERRMQHLRKR